MERPDVLVRGYSEGIATVGVAARFFDAAVARVERDDRDCRACLHHLRVRLMVTDSASASVLPFSAILLSNLLAGRCFSFSFLSDTKKENA